MPLTQSKEAALAAGRWKVLILPLINGHPKLRKLNPCPLSLLFLWAERMNEQLNRRLIGWPDYKDR